MSDTPLTDAKWKSEWDFHYENGRSSPAHGMYDFAGELEKQLATMREALIYKVSLKVQVLF